MTGVLMLVMGLARLGFLVNFISHSVVIGFTVGAAVLIAVSQLRNFFGVSAPGINFIDSSGAELLAQEARRHQMIGGGLYFHRLRQSAVDMLERAGHLQDIRRENLFDIGQNVIEAIYSKLDSEVCRIRPTRIFKQCQSALPNAEPRAPTAATFDRGRHASQAAT